jgi:DNA-binding transcriptional regulator YhcF (GntR family)
MTRPTRIEINCETLEETIIELTDAEIAEMEAAAEAYAAEQAEREASALAAAEAKASAEAKLAAIGLTADEVAAIIGR